MKTFSLKTDPYIKRNHWIDVLYMSSKVVFVGNSASGKSTIRACFVGDIFASFSATKEPSFPSLGVYVANYIAPSGNNYQLWDGAGKEKLMGPRDSYYYKADIVCVFHGGEQYKTPEQWEIEIKQYAPNARIHHIKGGLYDKRALVRQILV